MQLRPFSLHLSICKADSFPLDFVQAAALAEKDAAEGDSEISDTETAVTGGQSQGASRSNAVNGPANASKAASKAGGKAGGKKDKKKAGAAAVSEADEARELAEMRKGGFITGEGKKGVSLCMHP